MASKATFNCLLVPTDFSDNSWSAFLYARQIVGGEEAEIVVMHTIDPAMIDQIVLLGMGDHDEILQSMRKNALNRLNKYSEQSDDAIKIDTLVCEGEPFYEIIQKAEDFAVDAIVMSKLGLRSQAKSLLFGSTAEKVIRGSAKPVLVLPRQKIE